MIANKFVTVDLGFKTFVVSAGILAYPITFIVTDLISELYGQKKANKVVFSGFIASIFVLIFLWLGGQFNAISDSVVDNETYDVVFRNAWRIIAASMIAYLFAQSIDVRLFHFWKKLTKGKHLWLRNNFSTFTSQFVDTFTIVSLLIVFGILPQDKFLVLILSGFLFKVIVAILDTPLLYLFVWMFRKKFNLKVGEELKLN